MQDETDWFGVMLLVIVLGTFPFAGLFLILLGFVCYNGGRTKAGEGERPSG